MSTYLVAYANGPFEFVEGSYTSPLSGKVRPLRFYGMHGACNAFSSLSANDQFSHRGLHSARAVRAYHHGESHARIREDVRPGVSAPKVGSTGGEHHAQTLDLERLSLHAYKYAHGRRATSTSVAWRIGQVRFSSSSRSTPLMLPHRLSSRA